MTLHFARVFVLTTVSVLLQPPSSSQADDDGYVSLFNGRDLSGWVMMGDERGWKVKDGVIRSESAKGGEWLRSAKEYRNFELHVDWRVSNGGNSGVFIRASETGQPWLTGYEVQITNAPRDDEHCTGSLYGYVAADPRPDESADVWHTFQIRCECSHITVFADGVRCVHCDQTTSDTTRNKPQQGYIGLQDSHSLAGHSIEYRNVRIRVLD